MARMRWAVAIVAAAALLSGCSGQQGKATVANVGPLPDPFNSGLLVGTQATVDIEGPVTNAALECDFSGQHFNADGSSYDGWTEFVQLPDLASGATTRVTCEAASLKGGGAQPSSPIIQIVNAKSLPTTRSGLQVEYTPPTPWP